MANFDACLAIVLRHEGGYVDHPRDPGGATNLGVTIGTLSQWLGRKATKDEVRALTVEKVKPIYKRNYWDAIGGDMLPAGVDLAVFDPAVNSGVGRAKKWHAAGKRETPVATVKAICAVRMSFLRGLSTFGTFGKGWTRRVAEIEAKGVRMATGSNPAPVLKKEAEKAKASRDNSTKGAVTTGTAGASGGAVAATTQEPWTTLEIAMAVGAGVAIVALAAFLGWKIYTNHIRKDAYEAEAENVAETQGLADNPV